MAAASKVLLHHPESILFVLDIDAETATEATKGLSKLQVLQQCISLIVNTKRKLSSAHRYGLCTFGWRADLALPFTGNADRFLSSLTTILPSATQYTSADLGSLIEVASPLRQQEAALGSALRVVLLYARSDTTPAWASHTRAGLAADCVYLHDKPEPGVNSPQAVYTALEDYVDVMAQRAGHTAYIYEASSHNMRKLMNQVVQVMSHPAQRVQQTELPAAVDLAVAPPRMWAPGKGAVLMTGPAVAVVVPQQAALPGVFSYSAAAQTAAAAAAAAAAGAAQLGPLAAGAAAGALAPPAGVPLQQDLLGPPVPMQQQQQQQQQRADAGQGVAAGSGVLVHYLVNDSQQER